MDLPDSARGAACSQCDEWGLALSCFVAISASKQPPTRTIFFGNLPSSMLRFSDVSDECKRKWLGAAIAAIEQPAGLVDCTNGSSIPPPEGALDSLNAWEQRGPSSHMPHFEPPPPSPPPPSPPPSPLAASAYEPSSSDLEPDKVAPPLPPRTEYSLPAAPAPSSAPLEKQAPLHPPGSQLDSSLQARLWTDPAVAYPSATASPDGNVQEKQEVRVELYRPGKRTEYLSLPSPQIEAEQLERLASAAIGTPVAYLSVEGKTLSGLVTLGEHKLHVTEARMRGGMPGGARRGSAAERLLLLDLPPDMIREVVQQLPSSDLLPAALISTPFRLPCSDVASEQRAADTKRSDEATLFLTSGTTSLTRFDWAVREMGAEPDHRWAAAAARRGDIGMLQCMLDRGVQVLHVDVTAAAAGGGSIPTLAWLHYHHAPLDDSACSEACREGRLDALRYLRVHDAPYDGEAGGEWACAHAAIIGGHLHVLRYLKDVGMMHDSIYMFFWTASWFGRIDVLIWLMEEPGVLDAFEDPDGLDWGELCASCAVCGGQLTVLKWLREEKGIEWEWGRDLDRAISDGRLDIVKYLREQGAEWYERSCYDAALYGHLDLLRWMRDGGAVWDAAECLQAAAEEGKNCRVDEDETRPAPDYAATIAWIREQQWRAAFEAVFYSDPLLLVLSQCSAEQALQVARVNKGIRNALRRLRPGLALRSITLALEVAGGGLFRVEELNLTSLADVTPVSPLVDLTDLDLSGTRVTDVAPLSSLVELTILKLSFTRVADVTPLSPLVKLTVLGLHDTRVKDITPLSTLVRLTILYLHSTRVANVAPLSSLVELTILKLNSTRVKDVTPLSPLVKLTELGLSRTRIADVTPLSPLVNLTVLDLHHTRVADVTPLSPLVNLTHLYLYSTRVADVTPLSPLVNLTHLSLCATKVTDLRPLGELDKLRIIRGLEHLQRDVLLSDQSRRRMLLHEGETVGELAARLGCDHLAVDGVQLDGDERVVDVEGELQM